MPPQKKEAGGGFRRTAAEFGMRPKWGYAVKERWEIAELGKNDLGAALNVLGDQGWELVAVSGATFFFKRPESATAMREFPGPSGKGRGSFPAMVTPSGGVSKSGKGKMPSTRGSTESGGKRSVGQVGSVADNMFRRLDLNGDGVLNYDEMPDTLRIERDKYDLDRNGLIDLNEFRAYYQARLQQVQSRWKGSWISGLP